MNLINVLWVKLSFLDKFEHTLNTFSEKYLSSPTVGYLLFGLLFAGAVLFIRGFSKK